MKYLETQIHNVTAGEAIVIAKLNGQIITCNEEALSIYQYPSIQSIKQHTLIDLMPEDFAPFFPKEMTPEHLNINNYQTHVNRRKNGELFACKLHTHYQLIAGNKYLIGHVKEIKENVDIEKLCLQQNIVVLKRELEVERNKNTYNSYQQTSQHLTRCYPTLSANDLKVCHYLLLNCSTKYISEELNITVDGVFAARKRIRKKLGLQPSDDLVKVLLHCQKTC